MIEWHIGLKQRDGYSNKPYVADFLERTLTGDYAHLCDMLLTMTAVAKGGMQMFHIQGPVGLGKTMGILALCVLFSLHLDGNIMICTSQNAPCDNFTEDMYEVYQQCNIL